MPITGTLQNLTSEKIASSWKILNKRYTNFDKKSEFKVQHPQILEIELNLGRGWGWAWLSRRRWAQRRAIFFHPSCYYIYDYNNYNNYALPRPGLLEMRPNDSYCLLKWRRNRNLRKRRQRLLFYRSPRNGSKAPTALYWMQKPRCMRKSQRWKFPLRH